MPFATRTRVSRDAMRRAILECDRRSLREYALATLTGSIDARCLEVARAAAWAVGLDAVIEKPYAAGGSIGRPGMNPLLMASLPGLAWSLAATACTIGVEGGSVGDALLPALAATLLQPGSLAQGVFIALALVAHAIGREGRAEHVAITIWEDDGVGSAIFYEVVAAAQPHYLYRIGYSGLPDVSEPCASLGVLTAGVPLGEILRISGETSIVYRDIVEGLPRARSLALDPVTTYWEAIRVYVDESGLMRRCGAKPLDPRNAAIEGCTAGDVLDLAVLASFLALLDSSLFDSLGYTV